jgi:16S rRNA (guanine1207-N2)-methyltransferase
MIKELIGTIELKLYTDEDVFSPKGVDAGTKAMLSYVTLTNEDKVLDLGCGYGIVGIWAAKQIGSKCVTMCDINPKAISCSKHNALENGVEEGLTILESNGLTQIEDHDFTLILSNPPYHVDFSVPKLFIEQGYKKLKFGGKMIMVVKRKDWYKNKLTSIFGGVTVHEKDGYFIFIAEKRAKTKKTSAPKEQKLSKKLARKKGIK